jgi:hypothetical protein
MSLSREQGDIHRTDIAWTADRLEHGVMVKLEALPFLVRLFKIVATNGDIDRMITNAPHPIDAQAVQLQNDQRWPVAQFHRELTRLTGSEKCQARKARSHATTSAAALWPGYRSRSAPLNCICRSTKFAAVFSLIS